VGREKATGAGTLPLPFQFLAAWVGVWVARHQTDQIEYLKTVNRGLMQRFGKKRLRFTDAERRKLPVLGRSAHEFVQHYRFERNHQGLGNNCSRARRPLRTRVAGSRDAKGSVDRFNLRFVVEQGVLKSTDTL
jgi:hypothetical protein